MHLADRKVESIQAPLVSQPCGKGSVIVLFKMVINRFFQDRPERTLRKVLP